MLICWPGMPESFLPGFEAMQPPDNALWHYLQQQSPETFQALSQSAPPEVLEIFAHNIRGLVGHLPSEQFGVQVVTSRESLAKMLSGAMMGGYFLHKLEQRLNLEQTIAIPASTPTHD